ncbi:MAG TPA: Ig domain-containing protein [Acidimicrobiales bacterium]|nr:Ig domain-containing protein [Acidimicrobiales bacterium]
MTSGVATAMPVGCAQGPSDSQVYINCALPPATTPYADYTDGQAINLSMGANSTFSGAADIVAIECEFNNGTGNPGDPPNANFCDAATAPGDMPYSAHGNGGFDYSSDNNGDLANVFAVPGTNFHGATITCDGTHACVWYVGENFNDFTAPHVFSNPFFVGASGPRITGGNATTLAVGALGRIDFSTSGFGTAPDLSESGNLPSGMNFGVTQDDNGLIYGTPQVGSGGSHTITLTASNGPQSTSLTFTINVTWGITTQESAIVPATIGGSYGPINFTASGGLSPFKWKATGSLPKGVKFKNGVLAGTVSTKAAAGTYNFTVTVTTHKQNKPTVIPSQMSSASYSLVVH